MVMDWSEGRQACVTAATNSWWKARRAKTLLYGGNLVEITDADDGG